MWRRWRSKLVNQPPRIPNSSDTLCSDNWNGLPHHLLKNQFHDGIFVYSLAFCLRSGSILGSFPIVWVLCMCERFHSKVRGLWWRTSKWSLQYIHAFLACHTLRDRSMGTFHGENWPKALSEHGRGGISVILTPNQRFWAFFDYEFFPAELAEGRFQTWIRLVWVVLICGKISDWCWSCSNHARKMALILEIFILVYF